MGNYSLPLALLLCVALIGCADEKTKTKLIYFGFGDRSEKSVDAIALAKRWGEHPPCPHWRATVNRNDADYQLLFGNADVSLIGRRGEVLYSGGPGVLYAPNGNPDGSGTNVCKLTGD